MTYTQAKLIIWNPEAYDRAKVRAAVAFILGSLSARREDVDRAMGTMGTDAFRVCIGIKPRTHSLEEIICWMRAMAATLASQE